METKSKTRPITPSTFTTCNNQARRVNRYKGDQYIRDAAKSFNLVKSIPFARSSALAFIGIIRPMHDFYSLNENRRRVSEWITISVVVPHFQKLCNRLIFKYFSYTFNSRSGMEHVGMRKAFRVIVTGDAIKRTLHDVNWNTAHLSRAGHINGPLPL